MLSPETALSLQDIAYLWSQERQGTSLERSSTDLLTELLDACRRGAFTLARGQDELRLSLWRWRELSRNVKVLDDSSILSSLKLTRDEFFRWVDEREYIRPTFWNQRPDPVTHATKRPPTKTKKARERRAPVLERVVADMHAYVKAGKTTYDALCSEKKPVLATMFNTSETTAYDAAQIIKRRQKQ